ncbi:MAG: PGPGW domain-containing protein [Verrucomicrobiota bacterium]|nr:PGPGW domain-containing protein [Verrucomicrobiota bacterium]
MKSHSQAKKIVIGIIGGTVVLIGIALIVLPGPAFIVIPAGLAILATEFAWAQRWLKKAKEIIQEKKEKIKEEKKEEKNSLP